ncbi:hypothetical protein ACNF49_29770 [Actinomadura sp. ATCC 39365]
MCWAHSQATSGAGGTGLGERVGDGLLQVGVQRGRRRGDLCGQWPEHGLGLFQAHLPAVAAAVSAATRSRW